MRNNSQQPSHQKAEYEITPMEASPTDIKFRQDLAKLISDFETATGNRVSANLAIVFKGQEKGSSFAPLSYCRDLLLTDETGADTPRPSMVNSLDIDDDLSVITTRDLDPVVRLSAQVRQIRQYSDSTSGKFVVDGGEAVYEKDSLKDIEQSDMPAMLKELLQVLGGANLH